MFSFFWLFFGRYFVVCLFVCCSCCCDASLGTCCCDASLGTNRRALVLDTHTHRRVSRVRIIASAVAGSKRGRSLLSTLAALFVSARYAESGVSVSWRCLCVRRAGHRPSSSSFFCHTVSLSQLNHTVVSTQRAAIDSPRTPEFVPPTLVVLAPFPTARPARSSLLALLLLLLLLLCPGWPLNVCHRSCELERRIFRGKLGWLASRRR